MWMIVYVHDEASPRGWYVLDADRPKHFPLSGPHAKHEDAVQAAETRSYRLAQGWAP